LGVFVEFGVDGVFGVLFFSPFMTIFLSGAGLTGVLLSCGVVDIVLSKRVDYKVSYTSRTLHRVQGSTKKPLFTSLLVYFFSNVIVFSLDVCRLFNTSAVS
jgi:hypothetical protein